MTVVDLLVANTSVLIDLERGSLVEATFELPHRMVIPDHLYERELKQHGGEELLSLGLVVVDLTGQQVELARTYRRERPVLSWPDVFALALADTMDGTLLTGDRRLRDLALAHDVRCHSLLWLLDEMRLNGIANHDLHTSLQAISGHSRWRLPRREVEERLASYAEAKPNGNDRLA